METDNPDAKEYSSTPLEMATLAERNATTNSEPPLVNSQEDRPLGLTKKNIPIYAAFMISMLFGQLDQTIVATAMPQIASHFDQLAQSAWIESAYLLVFAGLMMFQGQLLTIVPAKYVYLGSMFIFALGSLICAVAPSFPVLVLGRAIGGGGGGGITNSVLIIIAQASRLEDRTIVFSLLGMTHALAVIIGPLIGGAFTDRVTWRWCFFLNLPFMGVLIAAVAFFLPQRAIKSGTRASFSFREILRKLDWIGAALSLVVVVTVLLPLQWGGYTYRWSDARVWALFIVSGILFVAFVVWQWYKGRDALLPLVLFTRRSQVGATISSFCIGLCLFNGTYFLPLWYQARGQTAIQSGVDILPFMLSMVIASLLSGALIKFTGHYWHVLVLSPMLSAVGGGLLTTLTLGVPNSRVIGYQILLGAGLGGVFQNVYIASQAEWDGDDALVAQATSLLTFVQIIGGSISVAVSNTIFTNLLSRNLFTYAPGLSPALAVAVEESVSAIVYVPDGMRDFVIQAYIYSVGQVFFVDVVAGGLASLSGLIVKYRPLKLETQREAPASVG